MKRKIRVCLVAHNLDDFVDNDLNILRAHFEVRTVANHSSRANSVVQMVKTIYWSDVCVIWFAATYAAIATAISKALRKKSIIIVGGYDIVKMPEIKYGMLTSGKTAIYPRIALNLADRILPFSEASRRDVLKHFGHASKTETLYLHVPAERYSLGTKKEPIVITIGYVKQDNLTRKGLGTFVRTAKLLPNTTFYLIGKQTDNTIEYLRRIATPNVIFTGFISFDTMLALMRRAKVYCQLSAHEGFGLSVAEAMLCGCVPVVTDRGSLPEVSGPDAIVVPYNNPKKTAAAIRKALASDETAGRRSRDYIISEFPREKRERRLVELVTQMAHTRSRQ
ncbi:MAG: glycosyltransferase family 4 protein [Nanoarchaeota archaeon]